MGEVRKNHFSDFWTICWETLLSLIEVFLSKQVYETVSPRIAGFKKLVVIRITFPNDRVPLNHISDLGSILCINS
jgi:hypothetical protein